MERHAAPPPFHSRNLSRQDHPPSRHRPLALDELEDCASQDSLEKAMDRKELAVAFNSFLESLPETERLVFLSRYWYLDPIADIAEHFGFSVSKVTSMLRRTRGRLRQALEKEELL